MATKKRDSRHDDETASPTSTVPASNPRARGSDTVPRSSAPPPSLVARWGRVRDGLAVIGNVETVMRSPTAGPLAAEVAAELAAALAGLRDAFASAELEAVSDEQRTARGALRTFAEARIKAVEAAVGGAPSGPTQVVRETLASASADLDAAAGLLELAERAAIATSVELSIASLAEQSLQVAWSIRARPVDIHVMPSLGDCSVSCDPHIVARLLAIGVALVRHVSKDVVVRTHVEGQAGTIEIAAYGPQDQGARVIQTRLVHTGPPTEIIIRAAAAAAGVGIQIEPGRVVLSCPRVG